MTTDSDYYAVLGIEAGAETFGVIADASEAGRERTRFQPSVRHARTDRSDGRFGVWGHNLGVRHAFSSVKSRRPNSIWQLRGQVACDFGNGGVVQVYASIGFAHRRIVDVFDERRQRRDEIRQQ